MSPAEVAVDSSVLVKWFKKGEEFEREALRLKDDVLAGTVIIVISEWVYLEIVRGLLKANFPKNKIIQAYDLLRDMTKLGFIEAIQISDLLDEAKELEIELNLYASDAVNLAPAIIYSIDMITEDKHLLRKSVKEFARKHGVDILTLKEYYS